MATSSISGALNSRLRISGMSSGLDIDSMVEQLMSAEKAKVDKVKQSRTLLEWKRDDYRSIINSIRTFKDEFFDTLKPATNMRSSTAFSAFKTTYDGASSSSYFTATAGSGAMAGSFSISSVQLAQAARAVSSGPITGNMAGSSITIDATTINAANNNNKISVSFNGVTKEITLDDGLASVNDVADNLNQKLTAAFGAGKITAGVSGGGITFGTASTNVLKVGSVTGNSGLEAIGFLNANRSNKMNIGTSLSGISGAFGLSTLSAADGDGDGYDIEFTINGKGFQFKSTQSLSEVMAAVNADADAGVTMSYDQLNDRMVVNSKTVGVTSGVAIQDVAGNGNLMSALGLAGANTTGTDAAITYDDGSGVQTITRSSNDFTINGIAFSLKKEYTAAVGDPIEVKVEGDATNTLELVKNFVSKYNELIDKINSELSEKAYSDYPPLTEEQRADMDESDIKIWEEKAKSGMLKNDGMLTGFVSKIRDALYQEVDGVSKKLYNLGITTGTWDQKGKLVVNETKLKEAITNSPQEVIDLFTSESSIAYSPDLSASDRATRDSENGIANRLYDIMQDYVRTTRNSEGQKGTLLEKAGIIGDLTENNNLISKQIQSKESMISTLLDKLTDKEDHYYSQFTAMEKAISQMNSQISWMTSQAG